MSEEYTIPGALTLEERRRIYQEGYRAQQSGKKLQEGPYAKACERVSNDAHQRGVEWRRGWRDAEQNIPPETTLIKLIDEEKVRRAVELLNRVQHKGCTDWTFSRDFDECMTGEPFVFNPSRGTSCTYFEPFECVAIAEKYERELSVMNK